MCHSTRVDPGYSTIGALQAALDNIVRIIFGYIHYKEADDYDDLPGSP